MLRFLPYILLTFGIIGTMALYALEVQYFGRTFHVKQLIINALIVSLIIGAGLAWYLQRRVKDPLERVQLYLACILSAAFVLPLLAGLSNRFLSLHPLRSVPVEFVETAPRYSNRFGLIDGTKEATSHRTFFYYDEHLRQIQTRQPLFPEAQRGDTVVLKIKKGLWGYDIVIL